MSETKPETKKQHVFEVLPDAPLAIPQWKIGENWVDLYAILGVSPQVSPRELEDAIVTRGADCVYFSFAQRGKPAQLRLVERHLTQFRPVLLVAENRRRYDALLSRHLDNETDAPSYAEFLRSLNATTAPNFNRKSSDVFAPDAFTLDNFAPDATRNPFSYDAREPISYSHNETAARNAAFEGTRRGCLSGLFGAATLLFCVVWGFVA